MANDINRSVKIYIDSTEAGKSIENLEAHIRNLEKELKSLNAEDPNQAAQAKKLKKALEDSNTTLNTYKAGVIETERVLKNLSGATYNELISVKNRMSKELKTVARGTAEYNMKLEYLKRVSKEAALAQKDMRTEVGCQASSWGRAADFVNKYMGLLGSAVAALTGITMAFARFRDERDKLQSSSANLKALTGLGDEEVSQLEKAAKRLSTTVTKEGVRIRQSAVEIDDSFAVIGSQRPELLKNAEALEKVTQDAIYLSIAGKDKLEPAAKALTTVMNQMNLGAEHSRRIINSIAAGSQAGAANIQYITDAFEKSGTTANLLNIELEQHIGLIEAVAPKYAEASIAGNSLDKVLLKMKEKGIGYKDGVFDLSRAISDLETKFKTGESAASIFGVEHAKMAEILVMNKADIDRYTEAVTGTNKAVEQAQINSDTNEAKRAQARNKMNLLAIDLMEKLNPAITGAMNQTVHWTGKLVSLATWISKNSGLITSLVITIGAYTAVIKLNSYWVTVRSSATLKATLAEKSHQAAVRISTAAEHALASAKMLLTGNIKAATVAMKGFLTTLGLNPVIALGVALSALVVGIYKVWENSTKTARAIKDMNKEIAQEKSEALTLFDALQKSNTGTQRRKELIDEINSKYGKYLENQLTEKSTTEDIASALEIVNEKLEENIVLKKMQKEKEDIATKSFEKQKEIMDSMRENSNLGEFVTDTMLRDVKRITEEGLKYGRTWTQSYNDVVSYIDHYYSARGKVDSDFWSGLQGYIMETYQLGMKMDKVSKTYSPFLPKKENKENNGTVLDEVVITPDNNSQTGTQEKISELKSSMDLVLKQLDIKYAEELARLKKFKIESNQTESSYNAELRKAEFAHYAARTQILESFKKKTTDKKMLTEIDKMLAESQNKVLDSQMKYKEAVNKILLDANPLDKEKAAYEDRLREVGLFGVKIEDMTDDQKKALELLEKQHHENILKIRQSADKEKEEQVKKTFEKEFKERKKNLETEYEKEASSIKTMEGFDFIPEEQIFERQKILAQKKIDMLNEEADVRRKVGLDTIEIQAKIASAEKEMTELQISEYQKRWSKYKTLANDMGSMLGEYIAGSETAIADMGVYLINIGLDMLKKQLQLAAATAMGWALTTPDSILTLGAAGIAKGLAIQALIEGVFAAAKAAISGKMKSSSTKFNSISDTTTDKKTGSYVTKDTSGWYDGGHTGHGDIKGIAGFVHREEFVVPAWEMQLPEAMNHVIALEAIRRQRTDTNPLPTGYASGGYTGSTSPDIINKFNSNDPEIIKVLHQLITILSSLQAKGVRAYVVYSDIQEAEELLDKSKNIGGKQ